MEHRHDHRMLKIFDMIDAVAEHEGHGAGYGRKRDGQVAVGSGDSSPRLRRDKTFVEIACGALPEALFESDLLPSRGGVHWGGRRKDGQIQAGRRGDDFPRRNQYG